MRWDEIERDELTGGLCDYDYDCDWQNEMNKALAKLQRWEEAVEAFDHSLTNNREHTVGQSRVVSFLSVCLSYLSVYLSVCLSVCLICLSYLSVLSVCLSVLSVCLICLSVSSGSLVGVSSSHLSVCRTLFSDFLPPPVNLSVCLIFLSASMVSLHSIFVSSLPIVCSYLELSPSVHWRVRGDFVSQ